MSKTETAATLSYYCTSSNEWHRSAVTFTADEGQHSSWLRGRITLPNGATYRATHNTRTGSVFLRRLLNAAEVVCRAA